MLLRDPIHGDITLNALETTVLALPVVQRLRGIKQLGMAYLVYPGAQHTRFEHSVGACAVAHRLIANLRQAGCAFSPELEDAVGVAALLHDVTHVPFGHTLEDERRLFARHDKGSRLADMFEGELGEALARLGIRNVVAALLDLDSTADVPRIARDIVSGSIDADLLDYLRRDSFYSGLAHNYDDRIFNCFAERDDRLVVRLVRRGVDRPDVRSEIISLLRLRYFLTERVYYHHTKVTAGAMLSKAVEQALDCDILTERDLLKLNDWTLLDRLVTSGVADIERLAQRVLDRDLLKRAYVVSGRSVPIGLRKTWVARYHEAHVDRTQRETEIAEALGVPFADIVLYCPALTLMKEAAVPVETSRGLEFLNDAQGSTLDEIHALQDRYADLWRFYVFAPAQVAERAAAVAEELFQVPNELVF
jgi:HD superfamily phosphohydrolase